MSRTSRPGAAVAAVLAAVLVGAPAAQAVPWAAAPSHGGESAPTEPSGGEDHHAGDGDHGDHGAPVPGEDDHGDHGAPVPGSDDHGDHGAPAPGSDDHGDHGEESGGGRGADPDTVTPETRRLVLSGFGGLNGAVLTAALLFRLRDRRTGTPLRTGRRAQR